MSVEHENENMALVAFASKIDGKGIQIIQTR